MCCLEAIYEDLARSNTVTHLFHLSYGFLHRLMRICGVSWVFCGVSLGFCGVAYAFLVMK